jgi:hypothetical protein
MQCSNETLLYTQHITCIHSVPESETAYYHTAYYHITQSDIPYTYVHPLAARDELFWDASALLGALVAVVDDALVAVCLAPTKKARHRNTLRRRAHARVSPAVSASVGIRRVEEVTPCVQKATADANATTTR